VMSFLKIEKRIRERTPARSPAVTCAGQGRKMQWP
jgi:hypothetical protein